MSVATEREGVRADGNERCAREPYIENRGGPPTLPSATSPATPPSLRARLRTALAILHRIIGAPDYDGYVAHARLAHPDRPLLTRDEFVKQRLEDKYSRPGSRCC